MISHTRAYHVHSLSFETLIDRNFFKQAKVRPLVGATVC